MKIGAHLGAVILTYGPADLGTTVEVLRQAGIPPEHVVLVRQPDGSNRVAEDFGSPGGVVDVDINVGYGAGMNLGLASLAAEITTVVLLTPGVSFEAIDLCAALQLFDRSPGVGLLGATLMTPGGEILSSGGVLSRWFKPSHIRAARARASGHRFVTCDWVDGAAMLVRRSLGPLPEEYFLYWEDIAYSLTARRLGFEVGTDPSWLAITEPGAGGRVQLFRYLYWRNRILCSRSFGTVGSTLASVFSLCAAISIRSCQPLLRGDLRAARRTAAILLGALRDGLMGRSGGPPSYVLEGSDVWTST